LPESTSKAILLVRLVAAERFRFRRPADV